MKLSEFKNHLNTVEALNFKLPESGSVPQHFHVTEVGLITRHFMDCGGTVRMEKTVNFQLWVDNDTDHRLDPQRLQKIIALSEKVLGSDDLEIEVEYQTQTIGKYGLLFNGQDFVLTTKQTACLAQDSCGIPAEKQNRSLSELTPTTCCTPGSACC